MALAQRGTHPRRRRRPVHTSTTTTTQTARPAHAGPHARFAVSLARRGGRRPPTDPVCRRHALPARGRHSRQRRLGPRRVSEVAGHAVRPRRSTSADRGRRCTSRVRSQLGELARVEALGDAPTRRRRRFGDVAAARAIPAPRGAPFREGRSLLHSPRQRPRAPRSRGYHLIRRECRRRRTVCKRRLLRRRTSAATTAPLLKVF
mmetsp:Transcript_27625/g.110621  ORF Transcript_27625/g.110621 Transcript_27625/m.110621 type:complete len:204 (-) Transcript_27625:1211-1822(-)